LTFDHHCVIVRILIIDNLGAAMLKFDLYKTILFPDTESKDALLEAVKSKGYAAKDFENACATLFYKVEENDLQTILAPFLRKIATNHLEFGATERSTAIRDQYDQVMSGLDAVDLEAGDAVTFSAFLVEQRKNTVYGTDLAAGALAEVLGVTFACTQVDGETYKAIGEPFVYYKDPAKNASIVHLYNQPGTHFFIHEGHYSSTVGDGNCLYNGFAQVMRQFVLQEEQPDISIYQAQQAIYDKIKSLESIPLADLIVKIRSKTSADHHVAMQLAKNGLVDKPLPPQPLATTHCESSNSKVNPPLPKPLAPISATFFFSIIKHSRTNLMGKCLLLAGLLALGIGLVYAIPAVAIAATATSMVGLTTLFFNRKRTENKDDLATITQERRPQVKN
jgi:hypothetical protein